MNQTTNMRNSLAPAAIAAGCLAWACAAQAQPHFNGHYPIGVEGLKGGSLPPPGVYLRDYNLFYYAERLNDQNSAGVGDFKAFAYAQAPRLIWITDLKILGGNYGMDVLVPFVYTEIKAPFAGNYHDQTFGLGDVFVEPITLSWHWQQFDLGIGYGFWAPTGDSGPQQPFDTHAGKGYWGNMFTLGGTWYLDQQKTWALSALGRYEVNMESRDEDIAPGDELSIEAGFGKSLSKTLEIGVVGYYQHQMTQDQTKHAGVTIDPYRDRVFSVGPEIGLTFPKCTTFVTLRYFREFGAQDRPEGNTVTLTVTKRF